MKAKHASLAALFALSAAQACQPGEKPVFLTFDTGHMGVAPLVAELLKRYDARATFFIANEPTLSDGRTLDEEWAPWWRARAVEGHDFGSHTWDHDTWVEDLPEGRFRVKTGGGIEVQRPRELTAAQYCEGLNKSAERFQAITGKAMAPIFRAPAGKTSPALLAVAKACGYSHVGWSAAGFLGDELPSERYSNEQLLARALRDIKPGDILMAHLGIWSRQDAWAPAVLAPLMKGLSERGLCFAPLREHPRYAKLMKEPLVIKPYTPPSTPLPPPWSPAASTVSPARSAASAPPPPVTPPASQSQP
ncbi:polysaccharide deacetylase family protein [Paucibacter sp. APW11]|uniref:Polysaccharide deacetylase family protein n=1 Tax=Roseateles aquae TaxID=3077235 RepID=A0ABU3PGC8_9BURK|nr:polysaccharide deacetylase family protein [Paucibacter sp. APW11]MDT9001529.1 polysaccharide deacetylase family protein [Paucibacter sp. APW11]